MKNQILFKENENSILKIGEFAKLASVSVRTLRFYDKKGLLKPSNYSQSKYRFYNIKDLLKLELILALKFIGLSLDEIKKIIESNTDNLEEVLKIQRDAVNKKIEHYRLVGKAIDEAEKSIDKTGGVKWEKIINIIKVIKMKNTANWAKQFYTEEQLTKIGTANYTPEQAEADAEKWNKLIADVRANMDKDPSSDVIQELADRWMELINRFTRGDQSILSNLKNVYSNIDSAPEEFKNYNQNNSDVFVYMKKVIAERNNK